MLRDTESLSGLGYDRQRRREEDVQRPSVLPISIVYERVVNDVSSSLRSTAVHERL